VSKRINEKVKKIKIPIPTSRLGQFTEDIAYIEIPGDIRSLKKVNLREANEWRKKTRNQFETAFSIGYVAEEIVFSEDEKRIFYRLIKRAT
jgi:predicted GNAT superfamily acetyltransferase